MNLARVLLGIVWAPTLSGCMMLGGMGHTGGPGAMPLVGHAESRGMPLPHQRAEASNGGLAIELSIPSPSGTAAVAIDARLNTDNSHHELTDANVWLRIQTPSGRVDKIHMQLRESSSAGTYRAHYAFPAADGLYLVTAEGRTGTGADLKTASVTVEVEAGGAARGGGHHWRTPAAVLGGLGMVAMMALMMGGS